jgi:hypothetical protein
MFVLLSSIHFDQGLGNVRGLGQLQLANQTDEVEFVGKLTLAGQDLSTAVQLGASAAAAPKSLAVAAARREPIKLSKASQKAVDAARVPMGPKAMSWGEASRQCLQGGPLTKSELFSEASKLVLKEKPKDPEELTKHKASHYAALQAEKTAGRLVLIEENFLSKWSLVRGPQ